MKHRRCKEDLFQAQHGLSNWCEVHERDMVQCVEAARAEGAREERAALREWAQTAGSLEGYVQMGDFLVLLDERDESEERK